MKKVLITGSEGFVGKAMLRNAPEGVKVIPSERRANSAESISLDLCDAQEVKAVISAVQPNVVVHLAAKSQVDDCEENQEKCWLNNVMGTRHLVESLKESPAHLVFLSSDFVFSGEDKFYKESDAFGPVSHYGKSKVEGEKTIRNEFDNAAIVRTSLVYGMSSAKAKKRTFIDWVVSSLQSGESLNIVNDQFRTPTYVEDLAKGLWQIVHKEAKGTYHLCGKERMSPYDLACLVAGYLDLDKNLIKTISSLELNQIGARPTKTHLSIEKDKRDLNYQPHSEASELSKFVQL